MAGGIYQVTEAGERELERMRRKIDGVSGPTVVNTPTSISVGIGSGGNRAINFGAESPILVTITSTGSNGATWKRLIPPSTGVAAALMDGGASDEDYGPAFNSDGATQSTIAASGVDGAHVWLHLRSDDQGNVVPTYQGGGAYLEFVNLQQTSGSVGNKTTASSWVYTVKSSSNVTITTGASPLFGRPNGTLGAASYGFGYWSAGSFTLVYAHEVPGTGGCP